MTKQYSNSTDIKVSQISDLHNSILSHNSRDTLSDNINRILSGDNQSAVGGYNLALVRHLTLTEREREIIERQRPIKPDYRYEVPGVGEQCPESNPQDKDNVIIKGVTRCKSCGEINLWVGHCEQWECPVCSKRKISKHVSNSMQRLHGFKKALNLRVNPLHWVLTSDRFNDMDVKQIRRSFSNFCQRYIPNVGGVYVIHMFRVRGWDKISGDVSDNLYHSDFNIKRRLREFLGDHDSGSGFWSAIKEDVLELGSWREYVYVSPHIHFLSYGFISDTKGIFEMSGGVADNGFLLKCIDSDGAGRSFEFTPSNASFSYSCECENTMRYLGSHAVIPADKDKFSRVVKTVVDSFGNKYEVETMRRNPIRLFVPFGVCSTSSLVYDSVEVSCKFDSVYDSINHKSERIPTDVKQVPKCDYFGGQYGTDENGLPVFIPDIDDSGKLKYPISCPSCSSLDVVKVDRDDRQNADRGEFDHWTDDYRPAREDGSIVESMERIAPAGYERYGHFYFFYKWLLYKFNGDISPDEIRKRLNIPTYKHKGGNQK